mmetsp:Transcript_24091/g.78470  ORF Transcript_24091/g.78470 Transcript_24091/m.78470 type:complete len:227 (-) Transcript_24091:124-804(-)
MASCWRSSLGERCASGARSGASYGGGCAPRGGSPARASATAVASRTSSSSSAASSLISHSGSSRAGSATAILGIIISSRLSCRRSTDMSDSTWAAVGVGRSEGSAFAAAVAASLAEDCGTVSLSIGDFDTLAAGAGAAAVTAGSPALVVVVFAISGRETESFGLRSIVGEAPSSSRAKMESTWAALGVGSRCVPISSPSSRAGISSCGEEGLLLLSPSSRAKMESI